MCWGVINGGRIGADGCYAIYGNIATVLPAFVVKSFATTMCVDYTNYITV